MVKKNPPKFYTSKVKGKSNAFPLFSYIKFIRTYVVVI